MITRKELVTRVVKLSGSIDRNRWELAALASECRQQGLSDYAAIIGTVCRRAESTVSHWARVWEWAEQNSIELNDELPYSFYETAARYSERLDASDILELMSTFSRHPGATLESFRAELAVMAGAGGDVAEISKGLSKARNKILGWVDRMPTKRGGDCLTVAADALADALGEMEGERVTA